jgi:hypothetical protein
MNNLKFQAYVAEHVFIKMEKFLTVLISALQIKCFCIYCDSAICYGCGLIPCPPMKQEWTRMVSSVGVSLTDLFVCYTKQDWTANADI